MSVKVAVRALGSFDNNMLTITIVACRHPKAQGSTVAVIGSLPLRRASYCMLDSYFEGLGPLLLAVARGTFAVGQSANGLHCFLR